MKHTTIYTFYIPFSLAHAQVLLMSFYFYFCQQISSSKKLEALNNARGETFLGSFGSKVLNRSVDERIKTRATRISHPRIGRSERRPLHQTFPPVAPSPYPQPTLPSSRESLKRSSCQLPSSEADERSTSQWVSQGRRTKSYAHLLDFTSGR